MFQSYYEATYLSSFELSAISWIGTVQGFLLIVVGVLSGPLYDMGYLRALIGGGTCLLVLGLLLTSAATGYLSIFLSLSIVTGLGSGCLFVPSVAIVAGYFTTKRPLATGLAASGGSVGGVVFPIAFRSLLGAVGFGWTCRIMALIILATLSIAFAVMKPLSRPPGKRRLLDASAFGDASYVLFSVSLFFTFIGLYIPFFYLPVYAERRLGTSQDLAFYLLAIQNAGSIGGRILPGLAANYLGSMPVLLFCNIVSGALIFFWITVRSVAGVVAFSIFYGFFSGAVVSLPPTALMGLSPDLTKVGTRLGMSFSFAGLGLLVGNPIAGAILAGRIHFVGLEVFAGSTITVGFAFLFAAAMSHRMKEQSARRRAA